MALDHSALLEDNRFEDADVPKKKKLPPALHWFRDQDYLADEMVGVHANELQNFIQISEQAYALFVEATDLALSENRLISFGIPSEYIPLFKHSWERRTEQPYLYGRFDVNGVIDGLPGKVIEFNADTCSTLPETIVWQELQLDILNKGYAHFNYLEESLSLVIGKFRNALRVDYQPVFLGSAMGYQEDIENVNQVLKMATKNGFHSIYSNLEEVTFSEDGIFIEAGDEYIPVDVFFKFFPWDFLISEEPELMKLLSTIILNGKCIVLNPFYTMLWQNKKFLAYITDKFPENQIIAKTYTSQPSSDSYVTKPIFGRIGENVKLHHSRGMDSRTAGDYGGQQMIFQEFVRNPMDQENYTYQAGIFMVGHKAVALNFRCSESAIVNDDCEFFAHFLK